MHLCGKKMWDGERELASNDHGISRPATNWLHKLPAYPDSDNTRPFVSLVHNDVQLSCSPR